MMMILVVIVSTVLIAVFLAGFAASLRLWAGVASLLTIAAMSLAHLALRSAVPWIGVATGPGCVLAAVAYWLHVRRASRRGKT